MKQESDALSHSVTRFCAELGADPLWVQGAGGNVSWKVGDTRWVKASGAWLADACERCIFVPVDLVNLRLAINAKEFSAVPQVQGDTELRPSIETMLHALMPHTVVVHVHAVEVLALLVRATALQELKQGLGEALAWVCVDYFKPGAELAAAIHAALEACPDAPVVFMKNHGLVVGGANVEEVRHRLNTVVALLTQAHQELPVAKVAEPKSEDYVVLQDSAVQALALDEALFHRLATDWALYPDHVVFLGPVAYTFESWQSFAQARLTLLPLPELIFVRQRGVFVSKAFSRAKAAQLRCYYDVMVRQPLGAILDSMTGPQIAQVLNWDSERYRQQLEK